MRIASLALFHSSPLARSGCLLPLLWQDARDSGGLAGLPALLSRAAMVYRGLYGLAHRAGTAVPFEALPATLEGLHVWSDEVAAGAPQQMAVR
jgi:hypothetical protein